jgi:hypothetical protein
MVLTGILPFSAHAAGAGLGYGLPLWSRARKDERQRERTERLTRLEGQLAGV